jgi:hypothetical protein
MTDFDQTQFYKCYSLLQDLGNDSKLQQHAPLLAEAYLKLGDILENQFKTIESCYDDGFYRLGITDEAEFIKQLRVVVGAEFVEQLRALKDSLNEIFN